MSISSSNAVVLLSIAGVFPIPQRLRGFAKDQMFKTGPIKPVETVMGADGNFVAGKVFVPFEQEYTLLASSPSCKLFDEWYTAMTTLGDVLSANGLITLSGVGTKWTLTTGYLTDYAPIPEAKNILEARAFKITWGQCSPAVI